MTPALVFQREEIASIFSIVRALHPNVLVRFNDARHGFICIQNYFPYFNKRF